MATSKTLTPTNVTIQIPAFADKPDQRVNSNCIDKEADAINALSDQIANLGSTSVSVTATTARGTKESGGAYSVGKVVVINFTFKSITTASNSPGIASLGKSPLFDCALTAIDITNGITSSVAKSVPCGIGTGKTIFLKEIETGHVYAISGVVVCS